MLKVLAMLGIMIAFGCAGIVQAESLVPVPNFSDQPVKPISRARFRSRETAHPRPKLYSAIAFLNDGVPKEVSGLAERALAGDKSAQFALGLYYEKNARTRADFYKAVRLYTEAATDTRFLSFAVKTAEKGDKATVSYLIKSPGGTVGLEAARKRLAQIDKEPFPAHLEPFREIKIAYRPFTEDDLVAFDAAVYRCRVDHVPAWYFFDPVDPWESNIGRNVEDGDGEISKMRACLADRLSKPVGRFKYEKVSRCNYRVIQEINNSLRQFDRILEAKEFMTDDRFKLYRCGGPGKIIFAMDAREGAQTSPLVSASIIYQNARVNVSGFPSSNIIRSLCTTRSLYSSIGGYDIDSLELGICSIYRDRDFENRYPNGQRPLRRVER